MEVETLLLPVGWLATGAALFYGDRFLDRRIEGPARKRVGVIPFWWVFVVALAVGWAYGISTSDDSPVPLWVQVLVLAVLVGASALAFCARFGLRLRRQA